MSILPFSWVEFTWLLLWGNEALVLVLGWVVPTYKDRANHWAQLGMEVGGDSLGGSRNIQLRELGYVLMSCRCEKFLMWENRNPQNPSIYPSAVNPEYSLSKG